MCDEVMMELQRSVGAIEGKLAGMDGKLDGIGAQVGAIDTRLARVETRSVLHGAIGGGAMAIGIALLKSRLGL